MISAQRLVKVSWESRSFRWDEIWSGWVARRKWRMERIPVSHSPGSILSSLLCLFECQELKFAFYEGVASGSSSQILIFVFSTFFLFPIVNSYYTSTQSSKLNHSLASKSIETICW